MPKRSSASAAGFHFHHLYQCCPWKFFLRFGLRIDTMFTPEALTKGSAFHEGKSTFYTTGSEKKAVTAATRYILDQKRTFETPQQYTQALERLPWMVRRWIETWGATDLKRYKFLAIEKEFSTPLPGTPFFFSSRPDAIVRDKQTNELIILETKTSSSSIALASNGVYYGDQATAYAWTVRHHLGERPAYIMPDICYWHKTTDASKIQCVRPSMIFRSDSDIDEFATGTAQLALEIAQKIEAVRRGSHDPHTLFPRNTFYCNAYYRPCEFAEVCRTDLTGKRLPPGFRRSDRRLSVIQPIDDTFSIQG